MSNRDTDADPADGSAPQRGYGLPNQAAPLPRQWQMQRQSAAQPAPPHAGVLQHFYPNESGTADWRPPPARRIDRAMLAGLWLLVMLAAIAIGLRLLDLSALSVPPIDLAQRPAAASAPNAALQAAVHAAAVADDDPVFDDTPPEPPPALASVPPLAASLASLATPAVAPPAAPPVSLPVAAAQPGVGLAASPRLSDELPQLAVPAAIALNGRAACPDALRALDLCSERRR